jgi:hypothetical protein
MAIKPGSLDDFGNSMAAAIESELNTLLVADGLPGLPGAPAQDVRDRRRLFVAIARGVVRHLRDNQVSIVVPYNDSGTPRSTSANLNVTGL